MPSPVFTDSHCHLVSYKFPAEEISELVQRAKENGIHRMITLTTSLEDIPQHLAITEAHQNVFATIGIHPCDVHETSDNFLTELKNHAQHPKCCAIGETGLDYFHPAPEGWTEAGYRARQREFLRQHFELAKELGKNIVIHTRDRSGKQSLDDAVAIYREFADDVKAVFHCFLGPWENAQPILELGGYLSYTGIATFKKATDCLDAAVKTPADRIMVETDSPYLAPTPHRGKRNEPAYTIYTAEVIATARGISLEEFSSITEENVETFYQISLL